VDAEAPPTLLRISVGLEDARDLAADLISALDAVREV
jgi:cystathionine beta-lyase/cystathionine gamma-synthase